MPEEDPDDGDETEGSQDGQGTSESPDRQANGFLARLQAQETERWAEAIVTGAVTYVVGYVLTALLFFVGPASTSDGLSRAEELGFIGMTFNAANRMSIQASHEIVLIKDGGQTVVLGKQFGFFRFFEELGIETSIPETVYFAIPVVLLLTVGFSRAWRLSEREGSWGPILTTFGLPIGYASFAYIGTFLFSAPIGRNLVGDEELAVYDLTKNTFKVSNNTTTQFVNQNWTNPVTIDGALREGTTVVLSTDPTSSILMGLAYPLLFATIGAVLAAVARENYSEPETDEEE